MSQQAQAQVNITPSPKPSGATTRGSSLQLKCACGASQGLAGDCKECGKNRLTLQRYSIDRAGSSNLLNALATVSDTGSRASVDLGFGHDFSRVQVHTRAPQGIQMPGAATPTQQMPGDGAAISAQSAGAEETQTPGAVPAEAMHEPAAPVETGAAGMIVEDDAQEIGQGQLRKSEFLEELRAAVRAAADAELARVGRSTEGCPYIEQAFERYRNFSGGQLERALRLYAPEAAGATAARDYIPIASERVRQAVAVWARTGRITGVPEGISVEALAGAAAAGAGSILFKGREGGPRDADPQAIQAQLNSGHALDGSVRSRMESAFGHDFSRVRVHTNGSAAGFAANLSARAFTIGSDIAFGAGEYQPGTLVGDALLAHELAHVVQQGGAVSAAGPLPQGGAEYNRLEEDADNAAVGAVVSLWGGAKEVVTNIAQNAMPRLKSGLKLQRCPSKKETCSEGDKTITIDLIKLRGSSRTPATDLEEANKIYKKCCVQFIKVKDETVSNDPPKKLSDTWLGGDTDLKRDSSCGGVHAEEKAMFDGAKSEYSLSSRMRAFYVETFTPSDALAYSSPPYCSIGDQEPYLNHVVVRNDALKDTLAHELGHILLNSGEHKGIDNPSDKKNLMFAPGRTASDLDDSQCKIIYNNA
ncbi:MAG TPA: DUF4157 domain-containing protein [Blastocatellia bacterium]|jgi:hypothetical protein